jgi:hypothetical protein
MLFFTARIPSCTNRASGVADQLSRVELRVPAEARSTHGLEGPFASPAIAAIICLNLTDTQAESQMSTLLYDSFLSKNCQRLAVAG